MMLYAFDKKTGTISLHDDDWWKMRRWYCSENIELFFKSMTIIIDAYSSVMNDPDNVSEDFFVNKLIECLELNGDKYNYYPFYSHILGADLPGRE